jgi:hypothetical protein
MLKMPSSTPSAAS